MFGKQHIAFLEKELERVREEYAARITDMEFQHLRHITDLKRAHAEERDRVIQENQKLMDELTKVRYVEKPALQQIQIGEDKTPPPEPSPVPYGTPWQRVQRLYADREAEQLNRKFTKPAEAAAPTGGTDGNDGEGRVSAPLGKPS